MSHYFKTFSGIASIWDTYKENYHQNQIIIDLNSDYSAYLKAGVYPLSLEGVKQIEVIHQLNETQLIVTTSKIQALKIEEQDGNILLKVVKPSEKYSKIIVIDAGHGAHDPGTTYGEIKEKDLNLAISNEVVSVLKSDPNIQVYATREDDTFFELQDNQIPLAFKVGFPGDSQSPGRIPRLGSLMWGLEPSQ